MAYLGLGLDGGSMVQQDLDDPDMTVPGCAVQRSQLVLWRARAGLGEEWRKERMLVTESN